MLSYEEFKRVVVENIPENYPEEFDKKGLVEVFLKKQYKTNVELDAVSLKLKKAEGI